MDSKLVLYNTLTRRKEVFEPLVPGRVGMYVCGPTVYGDPHLGHARPAVTFDLLFRYLKASGYKVRYVRNITDVGHLEHDADEGEDKIAKKARLEQLEPMEVAHYYTERYHRAMDALNVETPSIEPYASGHIIEQIEFVKRILADGYRLRGERVGLLRRGEVQRQIQLRQAVGAQPRRHRRQHARAGRAVGQTPLLRLRAVEEGVARAYHAVAVALGRGFPGLAHGVLGDVHALPRASVSTSTAAAWT